MSLIIDALKKAQQLRLKEPRETPVPASSHPDHRKSPKSFWERRIVIVMGLASIAILAFIFWKLFLLPSTSIPVQTAVHIEKRLPVPIEAEKPQEPLKDVPNPELVERAKDVQALPKDVSSVSKRYPSLISPFPLPSERVAPPVKQMAVETKAKPSIMPPPSPAPLKETVPSKSPEVKPEAKEAITPPAPPAPLKESVPSKPIEVKPESYKDRAVASETLVHFNLGVQSYHRREFLKAIQSYQKVIELDPTYIEAYNNLGLIYQEMGNFDRAFGAYQKSIEINPRYEKGHHNLGTLLYLKGRNEEALDSFQRALAINPNNIESLINLGVLYKKQGQLNKAIDSYQKALDINPLHREIHYNIALLYERLENIELATEHYQQFLKLSSPSQSDLVLKVQRHLNDLMKRRKDK